MLPPSTISVKPRGTASCPPFSTGGRGPAVPTDDAHKLFLKPAQCQVHALFDQMLNCSNQTLNMSDIEAERLGLSQGFSHSSQFRGCQDHDGPGSHSSRTEQKEAVHLRTNRKWGGVRETETNYIPQGTLTETYIF